jgi:hypothetical protein
MEILVGEAIGALNNTKIRIGAFARTPLKKRAAMLHCDIAARLHRPVTESGMKHAAVAVSCGHRRQQKIAAINRYWQRRAARAAASRIPR